MLIEIQKCKRFLLHEIHYVPPKYMIIIFNSKSYIKLYIVIVNIYNENNFQNR